MSANPPGFEFQQSVAGEHLCPVLDTHFEYNV